MAEGPAGRFRSPTSADGAAGSDDALSGWGDGAGEGNRTLVFSLEGCCSTIELHPHRWPNSLSHRQVSRAAAVFHRQGASAPASGGGP